MLHAERFAFVLLLVAGCARARVLPPFSDWTCSQPDACEVQSGCGIEGGSCVVLRGSSAYYVRFTTPELAALSPGSVWLFEADVRCTNTSANFAVGSISASNRETAAESGWTHYRSVLRLSDKDAGNKLLMGMYYGDGTCFVSGLVLQKAAIKPFSVSPFGPLCSSESVGAGSYLATWGGSSEFASWHRTITEFDTEWNGGAFRFYNGNAVLLNHALGVPFVSPPTVSLYIYRHDDPLSDLVLSASTDGVAWQQIANLSAVGTLTAELPSAAHVHVKLSAHGPSSGALLYVQKFSFTANVSGSMTAKGAQVVIASETADASAANLSLNVAAEDFEQPSDFYASLGLSLTSAPTSSRTVQAQFLFSPSIPSTTAKTDPSVVPVAAGQTAAVSFFFHLAMLKFQTMDFSVVDSAATSTVLVSGRALFWPLNPLLDMTYGELLDTQGDSALWWCSSTYKIALNRKAPTLPNPVTGRISVSAARNEREAFQLVVHAGASPVTINAVSIADLVGPDGGVISSGSHLSVRRVMYVQTRVATDSLGLAGAWWPDPLVPLDLPYVCKADSNCPFWVLVFVDENATEGVYKGDATVSLSTGSFTAEVQLTVFNFSIPKHSTLQSRFRVESYVYDYHNMSGASREEKEKLWDLYLKSYETHRMAINNPISYHDVSASLRTNSTGGEYWQFYFNEFLANYKKYFDSDLGMGFTTYQRGLPGLPSASYSGITSEGRIGTHPYGTEEHRVLFTEYAQTLQNKLEELDLLKKTNIMWFDEPQPEYFDFLKDVMEFIRNAAPKLPRFCTVEPRSELYGFVDVWCPYITKYDPVKAHARQLRGEKVWMYMCCPSSSGVLNLFIDRPATELRLWLWYVFKEKVDGILVWVINSWHSSAMYNTTLQDPYEDTLTWGDVGVHFGNGAGRFVYPPVNWKNAGGPLLEGPVESLRWEMLRDGNEDMEYFKVLESTIATRPLLPADVREEALKLLKIPETVISDVFHFTCEPSEMLEIREKVGKMIETIAATADVATSSDEGDDGVSIAQHLHLVPAVLVVALVAVMF